MASPAREMLIILPQGCLVLSSNQEIDRKAGRRRNQMEGKEFLKRSDRLPLISERFMPIDA